ncbi:hypothetical protein Tco_1372730, partial [Tanacetum coccineum]
WALMPNYLEAVYFGHRRSPLLHFYLGPVDEIVPSIDCSISERGHAPENVTSTDLFYLKDMDGVRDLTVIDMDELARLHICKRLGDTWAWVACGLERQQVVVAGAAQANQEIPQKGVQADPIPYQRRTKWSTGKASNSAAPHTDDQPDP